MKVLMKTKITCSVILLMLLVLFTRCSSNEPENNNPVAEGTKILFIGNSLTFYNDVPGIFANFADRTNKQLFIGTSLIGGATLQEHSLNVETVDLIFQYDWDYVVLQGGGYNAAFPEYFDEVLQPAKLLKNFILSNKPDSKIIYFMSFAAPDSVEANLTELTYDVFQTMIYNGALKLADSLDCMVAPLGAAWRTVVEDRPDIIMYNPDGIHQSPAGAYLEACVYYATIFQESCEGIEYYGEMTPGIAGYLQQVGSTTVLNNFELWSIPPLSKYLY